jgi:hypothetical protein
MGILMPETYWGNKTAYFVASSWLFTFHYFFVRLYNTCIRHRNFYFYNSCFFCKEQDININLKIFSCNYPSS